MDGVRIWAVALAGLVLTAGFLARRGWDHRKIRAKVRFLGGDEIRISTHFLGGGPFQARKGVWVYRVDYQ